jgi:hypothetical protein
LECKQVRQADFQAMQAEIQARHAVRLTDQAGIQARQGGI